MQLFHQRIGQADTPGSHNLRPLLIEHGLIEGRIATLQQPRGRRGIPHAFDHHLNEERFELLRRALHARFRINARIVLQPLEAVHIQRELTGHIAHAHQMISSSARKEPDALNASRIDIKS